MDMTGVIPLPPANMRKSASSDRGVNVPAGGRMSSMLPAVTWSASQLDACPSATRLMVIAGRSPVCGELDSE
jgi:hypothetical protein